MHVLILRPYRKDNIYFRTIEEREKIREVIFRKRSVWTTLFLFKVFTVLKGTHLILIRYLPNYKAGLSAYVLNDLSLAVLFSNA